MINLKNVTLRRGTKVLLDQASVTLNPGEKVGLIGRNGAGKSSLLKIVAGLAEAVAHVEDYGSHHSDAIITAEESVARSFLAQIDSACVYWNASTRFTDGGEFGFGAEVGISTDRLHARGPMGIRELTTWKFEIVGQGQVRG